MSSPPALSSPESSPLRPLPSSSPHSASAEQRLSSSGDADRASSPPRPQSDHRTSSSSPGGRRIKDEEAEEEGELPDSPSDRTAATSSLPRYPGGGDAADRDSDSDGDKMDDDDDEDAADGARLADLLLPENDDGDEVAAEVKQEEVEVKKEEEEAVLPEVKEEPPTSSPVKSEDLATQPKKKEEGAAADAASSQQQQDLLPLPSAHPTSAGSATSSSAAAAAADEAGGPKREKTKEEQIEEERQKMQVLVSNFTEEQLDRYAVFRRAAFPKAAIKRVMQSITGTSIGQNVVISMAGIAKVFVGEVIEEALDYLEETGEAGPVKPKHLREASRRMRAKGKLPYPKRKRKCPFK